MKTLAIQAIACCASFLTRFHAQSATKFGDCFADQTFSMKVAAVSEIGSRTNTFPKCRKGQIDTFLTAILPLLLSLRFPTIYEYI